VEINKTNELGEEMKNEELYNSEIEVILNNKIKITVKASSVAWAAERIKSIEKIITERVKTDLKDKIHYGSLKIGFAKEAGVQKTLEKMLDQYELDKDKFLNELEQYVLELFKINNYPSNINLKIVIPL